jgi:L-threonylcarbamoyladenylate synthase
VLRLFDRGELARVVSEATLVASTGHQTRVISHQALPESAGVSIVQLPSIPEGYAASLYATLRDLDRDRVACAWIERVPETVEWEAVRDRVRRACADRPSAGE